MAFVILFGYGRHIFGNNNALLHFCTAYYEVLATCANKVLNSIPIDREKISLRNSFPTFSVSR